MAKDMTWESNAQTEGVIPSLGAPAAPLPSNIVAPPPQPQAPPPEPALDFSQYQQPAQQPLTPQSLAESLSQEIGVPLVPSFSNLNPSNPFNLPGLPQNQQGAPAPTPQQQPPAPPTLTNLPGYQEFNSQFQQLTGMSLQDTVQQLSTLTQMLPAVQQMYTQFEDFNTKGVPGLVQGMRQEVNLRFKWGENFDRNMAQVQQVFNTLPPQLQQALNSLEGAELIYAKISQDTSQQQQPRQAQQPRPLVSPSNRGASTGQQQQQNVPMSQLLALPPEQFYSAQVQQLLESGRVDTNA